jgi:NADH dehydrogenase [ubiquinone] 1 alpha subcomplex assembly factor 1
MNVMKLLTLLLPVLLFFPEKAYKIEFGKSAGRTSNWIILSDNVMGGVSEAQIEYGSSSVILTGSVSLKNRGGFVSLKSNFGKLDLSSYKTVKITFRSTLQKYAFTMENSPRWYEPAYKHEFSAKEINKWETVSLELNSFEEEVIGQPTGNKADKSITESILRIGISTNEKREGPFQLEIESIEFI